MSRPSDQLAGPGPDLPAAPEQTAKLASQSLRAAVAAAFGCQILLLLFVGYRNRHMLNPDGVAYLRNGFYWATGQFELSVNGYWGPMLSWLIAPFLRLFDDPLLAARAAMGLTAVAFLIGSVALFRALRLRPLAIAVGTWIALLASVAFSVRYITPDMLLSGLLCLASALMISSRWTVSRRTQFSAGLVLGAAYFTKGVALPLGFALAGAIACLWWVSGRSSLAIALRSFTRTGLVFLAVIIPWVAALTFKYDRLTVSTASRTAHALVAPDGPYLAEQRGPGKGVEGVFAFTRYQTPSPGRLTESEDSTLPFRSWSALESFGHARHQLRVIKYNLTKVIIPNLSAFDLLRLGLAAALFGFLVHAPWRANLREDLWRWSAVPVAFIAGVYLPVFAESPRYFYPAYPYLLAATLGMVDWLARADRGRWPLARMGGHALVCLSFLAPLRDPLTAAVRGMENPAAVCARDIADKLRSANITGSTAGAGDCLRWGGQYVEYVSFFLDEPYHGCEFSPSLERVRASGAKLLLVERKLPLAAELSAVPDYGDLDSVIFKSGREAADCPWKIYERRSPEPATLNP